jgi:RNA polymerase sigma-70 factor (ECF subfamily)
VTQDSDGLLEQSSRDIIAEAKTGSPRAIAELFERHATVVQRVAYRLTGNVQDAEDVVQDVFLGLPEALRTFDGRGKFEGWLHRVATRTTLMRLRRQRNEEEMRPSKQANAPSRDEDIVTRLTLEAALGRLPADLRTVFVLNKMEGYCHREIAALLGIRAGTSEVRVHRAIRQLRLLLENSL